MSVGDALFGGVAIDPGFELKSFRGETWTFRSVTRLPGGGSTGKVLVDRPCGHEREDGECLDAFWCRGVESHEFFPSVFDLLEIKPKVERP